MIPTSVVDIAVVMLIAKKVFSGKAAKIIAVVITSVFAGLCVLLAYACPYWNSDVFKSDRPIHYYENSDLTKKEALDKLEEVMDCLSLLLGQQAFYNGYCFLSHEVLIQRLNDGIHAGIAEVFNL